MGLRVRPVQVHRGSHGGGVNSFVIVGMGGDIVEEAVSGSKIKLGGWIGKRRVDRQQ